MTVRSLLFLLGLGMGLFRAAVGMEPLALLATQPVWQAGQPVTINVDYDGGLPSQRLLCHTYFFVFFVSACITMDDIADLQDASQAEYKIAKR